MRRTKLLIRLVTPKAKIEKNTDLNKDILPKSKYLIILFMD